MRRTLRLAVGVSAVAFTAASAYAQVDPLNFLKTSQPTQAGGVDAKPNVIFVVDTSNRMQRDAATDLTNATTASSTSNYYDPFVYPKTGALYEGTIGVSGANTTAAYRRKYLNMAFANGGGDKFTATTIQTTGDQDPAYARFGAPTRLSIARAAMYQALVENRYVARFGLVQMRQKTPFMPGAAANSGPVADADLGQQAPTDWTPVTAGRWAITRPTVAADNGSQGSSQAVVIKADSATANADVLNKLSIDIRGTWQGIGAAPNPLPAPLIPVGNDNSNQVDSPVKYMLDDAKTEAARLVGANNDPTCRNTIVVLIVGGGEGNSAGLANADLGPAASGFAPISAGRRVPIYVVALAPPASDVADLKKIAANSGGQYFEITKAQMDIALASPTQTNTGGVLAPSGVVVVPEAVKAIDTAVQHAFAASTDFDATPAVPRATDAATPVGRVSEFQVTSPIIGTVNLNNAKDITGATLPIPQPPDVKDKQGNVIPQRNNLMVTTAFNLPSFDASMRAFRTYKATADSTQPSGWKFSSDGTALWVAATPSDPNQRNLFTAKPDGTIIPFTTASVADLAPLMNLSPIDAAAVISAVRSLPLGAPVDSTPAFLNPPSLDPPPDDSYPGFASANKARRTLIWIGTNRGFLEAIDARTGLEVWGFVPLNLLPKLRTLRDGQPVGNFDFFVDGSAKVSDVKLPGTCTSDKPSECWRTHLIMGEGAGGTFYQSFDVTMWSETSSLATCVAPDDDTVTTLLGCFNNPSLIKLNWAFPSYTSFDPTLPVAVHCEPVTGTCDSLPYGDLKATATTLEKTVGQTWSDPAVGQVATTAGPYSVLLGSGFLPYATQQQINRGGPVNGVKAGTTFYVVDAKTGTVFSSMDVGSDGVNETVNNCVATATGCKQIKNALQTDPVATGPSDQRFITKAYLGDLDGNVWRFDLSLDASSNPTVTAKNKLLALGNDQPIFQSMATVNVGGTQQYVFVGTGSDLLPATDKNTTYHLLAVLDSGAATGTKAFDKALTKTTTLTQDERVTAFPAVAGDIVFFTTTVFKTSTPCTLPDANLYAFTFIGGAAYDTNNDGKFTNQDSVLVKTIAGQRATAPFIVDQHLVFGGAGGISLFGDPTDFNNGVGQAGVRILSWREVR